MPHPFRRLSHWNRLLAQQALVGAFSVNGFRSYLLSYLVFRSDLLESIPGERSLDDATRVAVFSHYDGRGRIRNYARHYLEELRAAGFDIVFVTNSERLLPESVEWLKQRCALILIRRNTGWDFGGYKDGIAAVPDLSRLDALLVTNDSVYGPFRSLESIVAEMDFSVADAWGILDSWERRFHLQSFFVLMGPKVLRSPEFSMFWKKVRNVGSKYWVIRMYEVGLTRALVGAGFRCRALCRTRQASQALIRQVREEMVLEVDEEHAPKLSSHERVYVQSIYGIVGQGKPINASHFFWEHLVKRMDCPFLKRELLRKNPGRVPFISGWEDAIQQGSSYDTDLILDDLEQSLRNRSV